MSSRAVRLGVFAAAFVLLGLGQAEFARAATGDVRRDLPAGSPGGVSVVFDGANLYFTDRNGVVLHSMSAAGAARPDVPIVGAAGVNALAYDATHDFFWAVDSTGLGVYKLGKDGLAMPQFVLVPALDLPGLCDVPTGCSTIVSGLAYDASTDSLWYAPQLSQRVYHLTTAGQLVGWFDTNETSGSLYPDCLTNGVSGLAAGANSLYVAADTCAKGFRYTKSDSLYATKLSTFAAPAPSGDLECDNVTFSATVVWIRSLADGHVRAVEVAPGTCAFGGGMRLALSAGWMSGAGQAISQDGLPVQHAFHILCDNDPTGPPNNLVVNWKDLAGNHFSFHLKQVTSVVCSFDPETKPPDPPGCDPAMTDQCFNTINGDGTGRLTGRSPAGQIIAGAAGQNELGLVTFRFTDHGEPNRKSSDLMAEPLSEFDWGEINVSDLVQGGILLACGCEKANYQAHQRPH